MAQDPEQNCNPTDDGEDLLQFMNAHNFYDEKLYQILVVENAIDLAALKDTKPSDVDTFITTFGLNSKEHFKQKMRFKQIMRKIHETAEGQQPGSHPTKTKKQKRAKRKQPKADRKVSVVMIGDSGCGKTSLMKRYCHDEFVENLASTLAAKSSEDYGTYVEKLADGKNTEIVVWDTAGQEDYQSVCRLYYKKGDAIIFCYDMSSEEAFKNEAYWRKAVDEHANDDVVVVMVGCKYDLAMQRKADLYDKNKKEGERLRKMDPWKKYKTLHGECSAKSGHNVTEVFVLAAELVMTAKKQRKAKQVVDSSQAPTVPVARIAQPVPVSSQDVARSSGGGCCGS